MATLRIRLSLLLTYFVFAILLNSVGTVILQVIHTYQISKSAAACWKVLKIFPLLWCPF